MKNVILTFYTSVQLSLTSLYNVGHVGQSQQQQTEEPQGPQPLQQSHSVFRNEQLGQNVGDEGNLMSHTHKDEATEQDVEGGVSRDEH